MRLNLFIKVKKKVSEPVRPDYCQVDVDSLELIRPRSIGCEHVALSTNAKIFIKTCKAVK